MTNNNKNFSKVTVIGDSLSLPRPSDDVYIDDIYPTLLGMLKDVIVFNRSKKSADTELFLESEQLYYDIKYANSHYFIIHLGICDCSPRIFTKKEKRILSFLSEIPFVSPSVNKYITSKSAKRLHHTKNRQIQNVSPQEFASNYRKIIENIFESNPAKKIFFINIANPGEYLTSRSHNIASIVDKYNDIISELHNEIKDRSFLIDINAFTKKFPETILSDGHHLNKTAHQFIFQSLEKHLYEQKT